MEFGMFHEFQRVPGQTEEEAFADSFEQVDAAERYGLDVMWLAELHTAPERSVLASPLMIATAIAARTKRMKIGTAVQVLPLCHPLQLAEEAATLEPKAIIGSCQKPKISNCACKGPNSSCVCFRRSAGSWFVS